MECDFGRPYHRFLRLPRRALGDMSEVVGIGKIFVREMALLLELSGCTKNFPKVYKCAMQKHFRIFENYRNLAELIFTRLSDKLLEMETEKTDLKRKNTNFKILITGKNDCLKLKIGK